MKHYTSLVAATLAVMATSALAQSTTPAPTQSPNATTTQSVSGSVILGQVDASFTKASKLIGTKVFNSRDENIGQVENLLIDRNGNVQVAVIGVGGFLGMGEKDVAVSFKALQITHDKAGDAKIVLDVTKDALQKAVEYKIKS